jgi:hypothetical protein
MHWHLCKTNFFIATFCSVHHWKKGTCFTGKKSMSMPIFAPKPPAWISGPTRRKLFHLNAIMFRVHHFLLTVQTPYSGPKVILHWNVWSKRSPNLKFSIDGSVGRSVRLGFKRHSASGELKKEVELEILKHCT